MTMIMIKVVDNKSRRKSYVNIKSIKIITITITSNKL